MGRTLIVGDVHGCIGELTELLDSLAAGPSDRVVFVGDLLARGPDSRAVLELFRQIGGRSVLGNHEARLLEARRARVEGNKRPRLAPPDYALLHQLRDADWELLAALPLYLPLPEHDACIVHAGIVPELPLDAQDPWTLTHVRSLDAAGRPSERHDHEPWAARYRSGPHIVFGHNSRLGLQLQPSATGLDTGCVYGGRLSALVLGPGQTIPEALDERRALIHSVPAARRYYAGKSAP
jgi:hypothetical protein